MIGTALFALALAAEPIAATVAPAVALTLPILFPAPRIEKPQAPAYPLVGAWALDWGACEQTTFFYADGTCHSPEFGGGTWVTDESGAIWFSEHDGTAQYVMRVEFGVGSGSHVLRSGEFGSAVEVRMRRGERLRMMPREVAK